MKKKTKKEKAKLVIGVDFDDTVFDFNNSLHAYHNAKYGTSVRRQDIVSYGIEKVWGCSVEEGARKVFEFYSTAEHDETPAVEGAIEALALLKKRHTLHLISVRGDQIKEQTLRWIERNVPEHFASINLTNQYYGIPEKTRLKSDVCKELGIEVMIEDSLSQAREIAANVRQVFLLDCPWNQGELPDNVVRFFSWDEILERIGKD